jgi:hypothetical protein
MGLFHMGWVLLHSWAKDIMRIIWGNIFTLKYAYNAPEQLLLVTWSDAAWDESQATGLPVLRVDHAYLNWVEFVLQHRDYIIDVRMINEYGTVGGMIIDRRNRSTRRKPASVPLCPPQIPHELTSNMGHLGGKPATNHSTYGTASCLFK